MTKAESLAATRDAAIATIVGGQKAENVIRASPSLSLSPSFRSRFDSIWTMDADIVTV